MEDVDLCRRLRESGWRIRYAPAGVVEHDIGGSQSDEQPTRWYRAFHGYVLERRGALEARATDLVAAIGFLGRAAVQARSRPTNARRMLAAGRTALALAFGVARPATDRPAR
jgi:GT2 family glycosyltransferase